MKNILHLVFDFVGRWDCVACSVCLVCVQVSGLPEVFVPGSDGSFYLNMSCVDDHHIPNKFSAYCCLRSLQRWGDRSLILPDTPR